MIVYGRNPVREAIRGPRRVYAVWATEGARREPWLREAAVPVSLVGSEEVERRSRSREHQGVCAQVSEYAYASEDALLSAANPLLLALDQVQDPHNLGSVCRTAECAGATGVVIPDRRAAAVTAAVCKASAGAVEHLAIARVRNLADFLRSATRAGLWCYGAQAQAAREYTGVDWSGGVVIVIGSEGRGLRPRVARACDELVAIPLRGRIESLSVSAAAAVLLYAAEAGRRAT